MERGFKTWCENQALSLRQELGLQGPDRLEAERLAAYLKIEVIYPQDIPDLSDRDIERLTVIDNTCWSAVTISCDGITVVIANPSHSPPRHEANVMHELGHVIRGHKPIRIGFVPWFPLPIREYRPEDEEEAKWLGGCLQIPRVGLEWAMNHGMSQQQIGIHFRASQELVRQRWHTTGIGKQHTRRQRYAR